MTASPRTDLPDQNAARLRARRLRQLTAIGFITPVVLFVVIFFVVPIVRSLWLSTQDWTVASFITGEAPFIGFDNYTTALGRPEFGDIALQTVIFTVASLAGQFVIGLALALFFNRYFPLSGLLRSLLLLPWLLPVLVSATVWRWMFNPDYGIVNAALGSHIGWLSDPNWSLPAVIIANIWLGVPFNLVLLYSGLQGVPATLYEAAALDGASGWQRFRTITWPLLRPVTGITLLLGLVYTVKAFDIIWVITKGGPINSSDTLATWAYRISFEGDHQLGLGTAIGELLVIIALIFGLLHIRAQRRENDL
ncbi:carbohydrate ABC transporter permease [Kineosporia babensis]|uniref:Sugar ABC transporter permease n=1 Tax=Kineosporia babensis TaxID=499548 RepID=A0A9X1NNI2_9ACTN|nr:sugar ABC transporter permease [Kineosporia babensis]MCD5316996.1 sugar ABC transporter permease [Kineosporia babensis]